MPDRDKLAAAFSLWLSRKQETPEDFEAEYGTPEEYGTASADYLLELLAEIA